MKEQKEPNNYKVMYIISGRASPTNPTGKQLINFTLKVIDIINNDKEVAHLMKIFFVPDYSVSVAEILIPAADSS